MLGFRANDTFADEQMKVMKRTHYTGHIILIFLVSDCIGNFTWNIFSNGVRPHNNCLYRGNYIFIMYESVLRHRRKVMIEEETNVNLLLQKVKDSKNLLLSFVPEKSPQRS